MERQGVHAGGSLESGVHDWELAEWQMQPECLWPSPWHCWSQVVAPDLSCPGSVHLRSRSRCAGSQGRDHEGQHAFVHPPLA